MRRACDAHAASRSRAARGWPARCAWARWRTARVGASRPAGRPAGWPAASKQLVRAPTADAGVRAAARPRGRAALPRASAAVAAEPPAEPGSVPSPSGARCTGRDVEEALAPMAEPRPCRRPVPRAPPARAGARAAPRPPRDWSRFADGRRACRRAPLADQALRRPSCRARAAPLLDRLVNQAGEVSITRSRSNRVGRSRARCPT